MFQTYSETQQEESQDADTETHSHVERFPFYAADGFVKHFLYIHPTYLS